VLPANESVFSVPVMIKPWKNRFLILFDSSVWQNSAAQYCSWFHPAAADSIPP